MSEMVERVAKNMHFRRGNSLRTKWEDCADEYRRGTMRDAHAEIEAMREPELAMLDRSMAIVPRDDAEAVWQAMIDEALR